MTECPGYQEPFAVVDTSVNAAIATDLEWHLAPEHPHLFCGGCGNEAQHCHPGVCCSEEPDRMNALDSVCGYCQDRYLTGQILHKKVIV